ncbi:MAG: carbohydrate kinase family protein [Acidobacteria bacterium]|nr:carbohydrate kinase family protein [Acidobacteriota bacterium]MCA1611913.1 carbohydrate kinase family protein [Acidobacteriota bacterium]
MSASSTESRAANLSRRPGRVVVTGSVAFDYLMTFPGHFVEHLIPDQLSRLSVSFLVDEMRRVEGGCAANIAYGLALLGERPLLFATAGPDAEAYRDRLAKEGVDVSGLRLCPDVFTASFFVSTDLDQNQIASFYTGAMARARDLSISDLDAADCAIVLISPNDPEGMARYAGECRSAGIPFIYDPSQQVARLTGEDLARGLEGAAILIANDYEMGILTQKTEWTSPEIEARVPVVIETHGAEGSTIVLSGRERHRIPAARLEGDALDPTGVGDAFRGGLVRGIRAGFSWEIAGRMGSIAAVFGLEAQGPQPPRYPIARFIERYESNFGKEPELEKLRT